MLAAYAWKSPVRALALALALAACAQSTVTAGNAPFPARPTGADDVVVQVMLDPTFGPPEDFVSTTPTLTVLGDSLVITPAPVPEIYPGPAMVPHQSVRADAAVVDDLVK
ncbi:MAG: hypothetical protein ACRD0Q_05295 [Acidimicrobiales bacterium]